ncbi:hypothetical protein KKH43_05065 [Patescibacteria group bacterium]|nr:hypothetical protein [Patescibacteria group bacterium]
MKRKVYVIARVAREMHFWTDKICKELDDSFCVFKPKDHNPWNREHIVFFMGGFLFYWRSASFMVLL